MALQEFAPNQGNPKGWALHIVVYRYFKPIYSSCNASCLPSSPFWAQIPEDPDKYPLIRYLSADRLNLAGSQVGYVEGYRYLFDPHLKQVKI